MRSFLWFRNFQTFFQLSVCVHNILATACVRARVSARACWVAAVLMHVNVGGQNNRNTCWVKSDVTQTLSFGAEASPTSGKTSGSQQGGQKNRNTCSCCFSAFLIFLSDWTEEEVKGHTSLICVSVWRARPLRAGRGGGGVWRPSPPPPSRRCSCTFPACRSPGRRHLPSTPVRPVHPQQRRQHGRHSRGRRQEGQRRHLRVRTCSRFNHTGAHSASSHTHTHWPANDPSSLLCCCVSVCV